MLASFTILRIKRYREYNVVIYEVVIARVNRHCCLEARGVEVGPLVC